MTTILSILLFLTFTTLGIIHIYWLLGGKWALEKVIPTKDADTSPPPIPNFATLLVAFGLIAFGLLYLIKSGLVHLQLPIWISNYVYWILPIIFIIRAIGDFKYVGFFKKIKDTKFAKADSQVFVPLCLGIGVIGLVVQYLV